MSFSNSRLVAQTERGLAHLLSGVHRVLSMPKVLASVPQMTIAETQLANITLLEMRSHQKMSSEVRRLIL